MRSLTFVLLAGWLVLSPAPAGAQRVVWDQAEVVALAERLDEAADAFESALEKGPPATPSSGTPDSGERLRDEADRLETAAATLAERLDDGDGRESTENFYKNVSQLASDTAELARNQMLSEPVTTAWHEVSEALRELAPYYETERPSPAAAERLDPTP
jgi:hypothetical protein